MTSLTRSALYTQLGIASRALADAGTLDEVGYRALLAQHGAQHHKGRPSASTMDTRQIVAVLDDLRAMGWDPKAYQRTRPRKAHAAARVSAARHDQVAMVTGLWCALADMGVVRDRSEAAMLAWCGRHTQRKPLEWATTAQLIRCIEGLKAWGVRAGLVWDCRGDVPRLVPLESEHERR